MLADSDHDPTGDAAKQIQQTLAFYELDLGLNHMMRKYAETLAEQSEQGDVFKVTLDAYDDIVTEMRIKYFDTLKVANAICILKTGFIFVANEFGNHHLYQIAHLDDNEDEPEFSSRIPLDEGETFYDTSGLQHLVFVDQIDSLNPRITSHITGLANEDAPQIYALCGRGPRSTMRVLRHGLEVSKMAISELPGNPTAVWTVKKNVDGKCSNGHIRADRRVNEWRASPKRPIAKCAMNRRQTANLVWHLLFFLLCLPCVSAWCSFEEPLSTAGPAILIGCGGTVVSAAAIGIAFLVRRRRGQNAPAQGRNAEQGQHERFLSGPSAAS